MTDKSFTDAKRNQEAPGRTHAVCQVLVIGAQRVRVEKAVSLLPTQSHAESVELRNTSDEKLVEDTFSFEVTPILDGIGGRTNRVRLNFSSLEGKLSLAENDAIEVEFLPSVASFGSFIDDNTQEQKRYLSSVEYHGPYGNVPKGSSLAPFFDTSFTEKEVANEKNTEHSPEDWGVIGAVLGCGVAESPETAESDEEAIRQFCQLLLGDMPTTTKQENFKEGDNQLDASVSFPISVIRSNSNLYGTMKEENLAFKALSATEKKNNLHYGASLGPGKMAQFIVKQTGSFVYNNLLGRSNTLSSSLATTEPNELTINNSSANCEKNPEKDISGALWPIPDIPSDQVTFACRRCRTVLFGQSEMEDPPHSKSAHQFSIRKAKHCKSVASGGQKCQSYFLQSECNLMKRCSLEVEGGAYEGKLHCTKCSCKVGQWSWAGAQCSCGTWVTPAIQVPCSKVDVMDSTVFRINTLPAGAVPYRGQDMIRAAEGMIQ